MVIVRDKQNKIHCARCNKLLAKSEVVKDKLIPNGVCNVSRSEANYIGVCLSCHKERLKRKLVLPSYWKFLSSGQSDNLTRTMRHFRSTLISYFPESAEQLQKI